MHKSDLANFMARGEVTELELAGGLAADECTLVQAIGMG